MGTSCFLVSLVSDGHFPSFPVQGSHHPHHANLATEACSLLLGDAGDVDDAVSLPLTSLLRQHSQPPLIYHFKLSRVEASLKGLTAEAPVPNALDLPTSLEFTYATPPPLESQMREQEPKPFLK